jgi:hypothetical protein
MSLETFKNIGGHIDAIKPIDEVLKQIKGRKKE